MAGSVQDFIMGGIDLIVVFCFGFFLFQWAPVIHSSTWHSHLRFLFFNIPLVTCSPSFCYTIILSWCSTSLKGRIYTFHSTISLHYCSVAAILFLVFFFHTIVSPVIWKEWGRVFCARIWMSFTSGALCLLQAVLTSLSDILFSFVHIFPDALGIFAKRTVMEADFYCTHSPSVTIF